MFSNACPIVVSHVVFVFRTLCTLRVVHCDMSPEYELSDWVRHTRVLESAEYISGIQYTCNCTSTWLIANCSLHDLCMADYKSGFLLGTLHDYSEDTFGTIQIQVFCPLKWGSLWRLYNLYANSVQYDIPTLTYSTSGASASPMSDFRYGCV